MTQIALIGVDVGVGLTPDGIAVVILKLIDADGNCIGQMNMAEATAAQFATAYLDALAFVRNRNKGRADA
jgi:hypothetical protein